MPVTQTLTDYGPMPQTFLALANNLLFFNSPMKKQNCLVFEDMKKV